MASPPISHHMHAVLPCHDPIIAKQMLNDLLLQRACVNRWQFVRLHSTQWALQFDTSFVGIAQCLRFWMECVRAL